MAPSNSKGVSTDEQFSLEWGTFVAYKTKKVVLFVTI
jgi:hypothetical protein